MREKKYQNFLRQHIKLTPKPQPSKRDDIIRLKFLEIPYRLWHKITKSNRAGVLAIIASAVIPYIIYTGIFKFIIFENKAKLRASLGDDEKKIIEMLNKVKLK